MDITTIRDYIGVLAPIILFLLSLFFLRNTNKFLYFFVCGTIINNILNILLKFFIKEPRPSKDQKIIEIGITNGERVSFDKFGMPSGHAQNCGFALCYITLALKNPFITGLFFIISFISMFQRYLYNNHTILQLLVGSLIGIGLGYGTYLLANHFIVGDIKQKKDDYFMY
jgi:membrane-associated phospholipid phosphatase